MYKQFLQKVDKHIEKLHARNPKAFACKQGCADCCVDGISVWRVEYDNVCKHLKTSSEVFRPSNKKNKCPLLTEKDACSIYDARPIVCRLWGAPLLFGRGSEVLQSTDEISKLITYDKGVLTCCNKNFTEDGALEKISSEDIINLELVLSTLAAINHVYCKKFGFDSAERFKLCR